MPTTVSTYYADELIDWDSSINYHNKEMDEFEERLDEVIRRNSIVDIARKVESHRTQLTRISGKFSTLQSEIQQQEAALKTDSTLVEDASISKETESRQNKLRHNMQAAEKEYVDVKFDCYNFLSGILKK